MKTASIRPITDLKNHTKKLVQEVADGGQSLVITQNGRPKVVVMGVEQHDRLQDTLAILKLLAQSQAVLTKTGRVYSSAEVRRRVKTALQKARR